MSSVQRILGVLGMLDHRVLVFLEPREGYTGKREAVIFWGRDREKEVRCGITWEALHDHFGAGANDSLKAFVANRAIIEHEARRKYLADQLEPDGSVLIHNDDI